MTANIVIAPKRQVFKAPLQIYDVSEGSYRSVELWVYHPKSKTGTWVDVMLQAQRDGYRRLAASSEWYKGREYAQKRHPEIEKNFIEGPLEWTGTVLDFDREELLEGITLRTDMPEQEVIENPRAAIASVRTRLGKKQNVILPQKSGCIQDLDDNCMPLVSHLCGVKNPKRELPGHTYLWIIPGFRPVVRGGWGYVDGHGARRIDAGAGCNAEGGRFAARFVSETRPGSLTQQEYETLAKRFVEKEAEIKERMEAELKPLQEELDAAVVIVE